MYVFNLFTCFDKNCTLPFVHCETEKINKSTCSHSTVKRLREQVCKILSLSYLSDMVGRFKHVKICDN